MATVKFANTFDGGTNGAAITTGNSGGTSGNAFSSVGTGVTYDNTHAKSGALSAKCVVSGSTADTVWFDTPTGVTTNYIRFYLYATALPPSGSSIRVLTFSAYNDTGYTGTLYLETDGTVSYCAGSTGTAIARTTVPITLNTWVRIEAKQVVKGSGQIRLYNTTESTTPDDDVSGSSTASDAASTGEWRFGLRNDGSGSYTAWVDDLGVAYDGWLGPTGAAGPPVDTGSASWSADSAWSAQAVVARFASADWSADSDAAIAAVGSVDVEIAWAADSGWSASATVVAPPKPPDVPTTQPVLNVYTSYPMTYDLGIYETVTGRLVEYLPYTDLTWNTPLDDSGQASATVPLTAPELAGIDLRAITTPWRFSMLIASGDQVLWFGPITPGRTYGGDGTIKLPASEFWAILKARPMLGNLATVGINGEPPADLTINAADLEGLASEVIRHALSVKGGGLPLQYPAATAGSDHTRTYKGDQITMAADALNNLSDAEGGPDIRFDAAFIGDRRKATWVMRMG